MATYSDQTWRQLKGLSVQRLENALKRDGWERERNKGRQGKKGANTLAYRHPDRSPERNRVVLHPHPKKTMSPNLLKLLLDKIGWDESDLRRLKLIK